MATIYDVDPSELIKKAASELKKVEQIKAPSWAMFVKTGASKERPPVELDWWYARTASLLRKIYLFGPIGVNKLRKKYGGKKNRGHKPERSYPGSGNIIRKILQQLEKAELVKYAEKKVHKGRIITPKGKKFLDKIATEMVGLKPRKEVKPKVEKKVKKTEKPTEAKNEIKVEKEEQK
ncbi:30S ribosomal protein S19e [Candidatus Woesearchaeota archaeon]|nr:30S ribosomal protein S19e [Candidatus Woesearchaeota archaeon]